MTHVRTLPQFVVRDFSNAELQTAANNPQRYSDYTNRVVLAELAYRKASDTPAYHIELNFHDAPGTGPALIRVPNALSRPLVSLRKAS